MMIGYLNANLITCQSYIYLYCLYGRTILHHVRGRRGGLHDVFGGVDDALGKVRGVGDDPLCPGGMRDEQSTHAQHKNL